MVNRDAPRFSARVGWAHTVAGVPCSGMAREASPAHEPGIAEDGILPDEKLSLSSCHL